MENAMIRLTLDVQDLDSGVTVNARKGETARTLVVSLTNRGSPYEIADGCTVAFSARKPDGNPLFNACDHGGSTVRYDFTGQETAVEGTVACEIQVYGPDNKLLVSPRFDLYVADKIQQDGDVPESGAEFTALTEMVGRGAELIGELEDGATGVRAMLNDAEAAAQAAVEAAEEAKQAAASGGGGGVKATVEVVDGVQIVTAATGAVTVKTVDGIQTIA